MVNCNPETVSTDYDTSDRLYFEPLGIEEVLAVCEREQPAGVVIQFGGQTPLKLARALEAAGYRILGTPFDAVDLAEDRERFGALLDELEIRCPDWSTAATGDEAAAAADRIGYPVLVRPSYVLGGRAMRVCYGEDDVRAAMRGAAGRVLVDRFLENAVEIDVDALCDGSDTYVAAVMEHVEEAGVHSGDSSCVLPPQSLSAAAAYEIDGIVRKLAPALGVVGLVNIQLAVVGGEVFVLEVNPRASRTVPFASKAIAVNLVDAACRLAGGLRVDELGLPAEREPSEVSVKAAVLPFGRFPGADPVLGPEMRSTGEVMASASDLPTAFAKAERAAGRPLPHGGTAFLSVRDADKDDLAPIAHGLADLGFELLATAGTAHALAAAGLAVRGVEKGAAIVDLIRRGRCDLVVNTPEGRNARRDGYLIREAALAARVPCVTTLAGAGGGRARDRQCTPGDRDLPAGTARAAGQDGMRPAPGTAVAARVVSGARRVPTAVTGSDRVGPYTLLRVDRDVLEPGIPGQFFMLSPPGRLLPRPMSLCLAPPGELGFLIDPIGPGTRALCALEAGDEVTVFGPLGNGYDLDVERPLLVGGGIGIAPLPYASAALGSPPAILGFRSVWHAEAAALVPNAEVVVEPRLVTELLPADRRDLLVCGPEPMLRAIERLRPGAQLAWEAPMACGYGACYGCVVGVGGELKRLCIEGPVLCSGRR